MVDHDVTSTLSLKYCSSPPAGQLRVAMVSTMQCDVTTKFTSAVLEASRGGGGRTTKLQYFIINTRSTYIWSAARSPEATTAPACDGRSPPAKRRRKFNPMHEEQVRRTCNDLRRVSLMKDLFQRKNVAETPTATPSAGVQLRFALRHTLSAVYKAALPRLRATLNL